VTAVDVPVSGGTVNSGNFDARLESKVDAGAMGAGHAVLYTPDAGDFGGVRFLVVDVNGTAGYQTGEDLVIRLDGATHLNALDAGDFAMI
jgi:hypothetical protein